MASDLQSCGVVRERELPPGPPLPSLTCRDPGGQLHVVCGVVRHQVIVPVTTSAKGPVAMVMLVLVEAHRAGLTQCQRQDCDA